MWMALLIMALVGGVLVTGAGTGYVNVAGPDGIARAGALTYYPSVRGVFLGQFALLAFLFCALAFWAIQRRMDHAGACFLLSLLSSRKWQFSFCLVWSHGRLYMRDGAL